MNAVEFSGKINKGQITLPIEFKDFENTTVRVIMLIEEEINNSSSKINILNVFSKMKKQKMFSSINDPVAWQKNIRDEWE